MCLNALLNRNISEVAAHYLAFVQGTRHRGPCSRTAPAAWCRRRVACVSRHLRASVCVPYAHAFIMDDIQMLLLLPEQIVMVRLTSH